MPPAMARTGVDGDERRVDDGVSDGPARRISR
jgi:hypothetical protein